MGFHEKRDLSNKKARFKKQEDFNMTWDFAKIWREITRGQNQHGNVGTTMDAGRTILSALVDGDRNPMENTFQICAIYHLVNVYITMERSTILNGSINYFLGAFSIGMLVYRRVYIYIYIIHIIIYIYICTLILTRNYSSPFGGYV